MIVWILMLLDILSFYEFSLLAFGANYSSILLVLSGAYLIAKGFFFRDFMSIIDAVWGIYIFVAILLGISSIVYFLVLFWIIYKLIILLGPLVTS